MRVLYLLLVLVLWAPGQVMSQVKIQKKPQKQPQPIKKEVAKTAVPDSLVPANLILPDSLNKEYQQKFGNLQEILKINFKRNLSGKLQFCSDTSMFKKDWFNPRYRFANTTHDLDRFESLLCQLNLYYLRPTLSQREQYEVLSTTRDLLRMSNQVIRVVDKTRKEVRPRSMVPMMASVGIKIDFIPVKGRTNTRLEGTQVYAVQPSHFLYCESCVDCLSPDIRCDLNTLKGERESAIIKMEQGSSIGPGSYYIFVTENDFEVERVIYYELRTLGVGDAGKVIRLQIGK